MSCFSGDKAFHSLPTTRLDNLRGKQGRVVIDEAAFHDDLKELLKAAMALLIWGGEVRVISTHDGETNPFNELVNDIRSGRKPYSLHRVTFDEALEQGLYKRICLSTHQPWSAEAEAQWRADIVVSYGDAAEEELFCVPSQGSGAFLTRALIESCTSPELPVFRYGQDDDFKFRSERERQAMVADWCEENLRPVLLRMDPRRLSYLGEDFGRSGDLTVLVALQETQKANFFAPLVVELRNMPFKQQEQIVCYLIDHLPRFCHGAFDARGNGQYLAEVTAQRYGASRISEVMLNESWYRENMPRYKAAFEDRTILLPRDADIIEDHRAFKMIRGVARLPEGKTNERTGSQRHGDSGIAGALAWFATGQDSAVEIDYTEAPRHDGGWNGKHAMDDDDKDRAMGESGGRAW